MSDESIRLVDVSEELLDAYADFVAEFPGEIPGGGPTEPTELHAKIRRMQEYARGENVKSGFVPATSYWLLREDGRILGTVNIRHRLTEDLLREGGHIGYSIRPSERRKGYGRRQCALALEKARALGFQRVLITCDRDNVASARIIEANGGVLEDERVARNGVVKKRYWIEL